MCAYQGITNVSFWVNFGCVINGWPQKTIRFYHTNSKSVFQNHNNIILGIIVILHCIDDSNFKLVFVSLLKYLLVYLIFKWWFTCVDVKTVTQKSL